MTNKKNFYTAVFALLAVSVAAGLYWKMNPPAAKPLAERPSPTAHQFAPPVRTMMSVIVPGTFRFPVDKYRQEPVVRVWMADKKIVESMPLETYLEGVIAQEMHNDWPLEALAAQAITSRTLTLSAMEAGTIKKLHNVDVSTSKEELQAYARDKVNDTVRQAVRITRGQVLMYAGHLPYAIYSACNGQIAATREESFPEEIPVDTPYFQPIKDNCFWHAPLAQQTWSVRIPAEEVASVIGYEGNPADIHILEKGASGRILWIGAKDKKMYGSDFRKQVGFDRLKSTLIHSMEYDGKDFIFQGSGWGNGVGLCQWGAYTYALQGWKAKEIVRYYYVGAEVQQLWH
ncbi:putative membrane protein [Propionispora sp. 2/2-37]|uniref:SpoIID/LytB domain-containing protein n=1 Tax=Propionispora sp. 2/2-37 TaxID=1677858 RepID=UPI0006BB5B9D|nr:SpoIID/LytB domain-containing protein [Propionispora sp. 2/2-37]CUH96497.1 putative membrane protein [Propionispora sp. 2/2-37]